MAFATAPTRTTGRAKPPETQTAGRGRSYWKHALIRIRAPWPGRLRSVRAISEVLSLGYWLRSRIPGGPGLGDYAISSVHPVTPQIPNCGISFARMLLPTLQSHVPLHGATTGSA